MTGGLSKNFHGVGIGPLSEILPVKYENKIFIEFIQFQYHLSFQVFKAAQPALLYLVPFTLLPLFMMAYLKGDLKSMWHEPFAPHPTMSAELKI